MEYLPLWREALQSHQLSLGELMFQGGAVLPPHGGSLAEHGARPPLHNDKPIISWQSMPKISCHMEGTRVSVLSIVFCYNCTCQKIVGARQLKGAYKKLMADINTNLQTQNGQKERHKRSEICDLLQALWQVLIWSTDFKIPGIKDRFLYRMQTWLLEAEAMLVYKVQLRRKSWWPLHRSKE